ncbi:MAG: AAA family ATPase [Bacteroidaceae bacterium]|nr:AAA family ATPase [Bacteroidaceae bacterium]
MSRTITIVNSQGGVGKTTTAVGLSRALARNNNKVLLVDVDPLTTLNQRLGAPPAQRPTVYECLMGESRAADCIAGTAWGFDLMPATVELVKFEAEGLNLDRRDTRLRQVLSADADIQMHYDYIIVDTPASMGLLTVNALAAAHEVIIPIRCNYFASNGLASLLAMISRVRQQLNPQLELRGLLLTHVDTELRAWQRNLDEITKVYADTLLPIPIVEGDGLDECYTELANKLY